VKREIRKSPVFPGIDLPRNYFRFMFTSRRAQSESEQSARALLFESCIDLTSHPRKRERERTRERERATERKIERREHASRCIVSQLPTILQIVAEIRGTPSRGFHTASSLGGSVTASSAPEVSTPRRAGDFSLLVARSDDPPRGREGGISIPRRGRCRCGKVGDDHRGR